MLDYWNYILQYFTSSLLYIRTRRLLDPNENRTKTVNGLIVIYKWTSK